MQAKFALYVLHAYWMRAAIECMQFDEIQLRTPM